MPGSKVEHLARRLLLAQLISTVLLGVLWGGLGAYSDGLAVIYGGLVSMVLAWLHKRGIRKAEQRVIRDPKGSMLVLYVGAVVRFLLLIGLLGVGMGVLKLSALPLFAGFVLAQLGFLAVARR
ncbi:MAG: ATP synthase subunit I [Gammaproteobacteria bacterium]|nr:ATP synthase subunit I [Gammaproteobacteria bacterium]